MDRPKNALFLVWAQELNIVFFVLRLVLSDETEETESVKNTYKIRWYREHQIHTETDGKQELTDETDVKQELTDTDTV